MKYKKQVDVSHYNFDQYFNIERWSSIWHQLDQAIKIKPTSVLEIGQGLGIFKNMGNLFGLNVETLDLDPDLKPDYVGSVTEMPFEDNKYDLVCAFQVLEHLPYEDAIIAFNEMLRVSRVKVLISLPDSKVLWRYHFYIPMFGPVDFFLPRFTLRKTKHEFDGQHYWEINKKGFELKKIIADLTINANLISTYRIVENKYHRFFLLEKK
jgi:predicted SAM-dependent methyltransferase